MQRLSAADLEGALRFVGEAADEVGPDPFPPHLLERLRTLIGCEWASYCELDRQGERVLELVESPVPDDDLPDEVFWNIVGEHPLCVAMAQGRRDALKLSDFYGRRELHRLAVYAEWFRPAGVEFELEVALPSPLSQTRAFLFDDRRRDFTERERALLNLLAPHLRQLHHAAALRRRGTVARRLIEASTDPARACVLVVEATGAIEPVGERALELWKSYLPDGAGTRPPVVVAEWLRRRRAAGSMTVDGELGSLLIEYVPGEGDALLILEEHRRTDDDAAGLTPREQEVIALVADGLRNSEIAERLWVSPATVRKHLENIYDKLGVHTRTAAVARVQRTSPGRARAE
jgi:DNA-binding CsgD family transcriptional regulator